MSTAIDSPDKDSARLRIGAFDGLRALAILTVVFIHLLGSSGVLSAGRDDTIARAIWISVGNTIDLFFVLSGFLLFLPVVRRGSIKGGTLHFYARRAARIQPEYWFCLATILLLIALVPVAFQPAFPSLGQIAIHVFDLQAFAKMLNPEFPVGFWVDGALWIIPVLVGLYLVFPPFTRLMLRNVWAALGLALAVTLAWKLSLHHLPGVFDWIAGSDQPLIVPLEQSPAFAFSFAVGMATAMLWHRSTLPGGDWIRRWTPAAFGVAFLVWLWASNAFSEAAVSSLDGFDSSSLGRSLVWENLAGTVTRGVLVLAIAFAPFWITRILDNRFAAWASSISFGVFMIHLPVAFYSGQLLSLPQTGGTDFLIWVAVVIPPSVAWAWFSRRFVGIPAIEWTERRLKKKAN